MTMMMQTLRPSQVSEYLRNSSFYLGLNVADDDEFSIPLNHMKLNTNVDTLADMTELLNTIRFWGLEIFPHALIDFAALQPKTILEPILEPYRADLKFITTLCSIVSADADRSARLEKAMETGNIDAVKYFHKDAHFTARAIALAAGSNALDCLQYALSDTTTGHYGDRCCSAVFLEAVRNGCMDSVLFLQRNEFPLRRPVFVHNLGQYIVLAEVAASAGQYDILKYLHTQGHSLYSIAIVAADAGHFDCFEFAIENGALLRRESWLNRTTISEPLVQRLIRANQLKLIILALSGDNKTDKPKSANWDSFRLSVHHEARTSIRLIAAAAECGSVECLEHLRQLCVAKAKVSGQFLDWISYAFSISNECGLQPSGIAQMAAEARQWKCLRYLITHDSPMNKSLATRLVHAGQLELYHLTTAHGCEVSVQAACQFARDGDLVFLQHAVDHGCERSEEILRAAARHGQLQCLIYAREQGCSWSAYVSLQAARGGHLECLQYLQEHGCPLYAHVKAVLRKHKSVG